MLILAVPLAVVFCTYLLIVHKRPIKLGDIKITDTHKQTICIIFCLFFFATTGVLERLVWIIIYWIFTIGLHLIMRPRNMSSKANKVYEEMKLNGYTDMFSMFSNTASSTSTSTMDYDAHDPENPEIREPEATMMPSTPYGISSNIGSTSSVDMRKRGPSSSYNSSPVGGGGSMTYAEKAASANKKD